MFYYFSQHLAFNTYKVRKYSNTEDIRILSVNNYIFEFMDDIFYCNYDIFCNKTESLLCESFCNGIGFMLVFLPAQACHSVAQREDMLIEKLMEKLSL